MIKLKFLSYCDYAKVLKFKIIIQIKFIKLKRYLKLLNLIFIS